MDNTLQKLFMRVDSSDASTFKNHASDSKFTGKLAFVQSDDASAYELYVDGRKIMGNEVYVGDPSDAPEDAKIIIDNTADDAVQVYSTAEIDNKLHTITNELYIPKVEMSDTTAEIDPNIFYVWGEVDELDITLATPGDDTIYNKYMFQFTSGDTATTLSLPNGIAWYLGDNAILANKTYEISIVNNLAILRSYDTAIVKNYAELTFVDAYGEETNINVLLKS